MTDLHLFLLAITPLALLIFFILGLKLAVHYSVLITLVMTGFIASYYFGLSLTALTAASLYGATKGLWPIVIVIFAAIYGYNLMLQNGSMAVIKQALAAISDDKRIQVLIIAWGFGGFLEAVAGYGTAVAIPVGILIALGIAPLKAAVVSLIANSVPTAFGAVGIPVIMLAEQTGLEVQQLSTHIILQLAAFNILLPFVLVAIIGGGIGAIRGVFMITLLCGVASLVPQYLVAHYLGAELPAFAGSLGGLITTIFLARRQKKGAISDGVALPQLLKASIVYLFTFVFIILCSPLFPAIKQRLGSVMSVIDFPFSATDTLQLHIEWLTTPGVLILLAALIGARIQGSQPKQMVELFFSTLFQLRKSIVAILAIVAMATVMDKSGMITIIATTLVSVTGIGYVFISPVIGALGTFVTGSDTNANVLFGKLQATAAHQLGIDPYALSAANTAGATGGKMISPQSIAIAVSASKLDHLSGDIMSTTLKYCLLYITMLGLGIGLFYTL
ncbi:L-lactate permease [Rosenbergiella australiborealis]|uniref:L-lactate permease n=1 Tax=Rosenbergiella australiborealis TaxID=1544696 RepID=A0ABS5T888_9GAMM|nr:L-lactate permease [Rosenbergiella australiborealis]MBT0727168.1 L-lactate permease [Rosenbergiella australiborealis]